MPVETPVDETKFGTFTGTTFVYGSESDGIQESDKSSYSDQFPGLANVLYQQIINDQGGKGDLSERWSQSLAVYMLDAEAAGLTGADDNAVPGLQGYHGVVVPSSRNKHRQLIGKLVSRILGITPIVQVMMYGEQKNDSDQEETLSFVAIESGLEGALDPATHNAGLYNAGFLRLGLDHRPYDTSGEFTGLRTDWFGPNEVCIYPNTVDDLRDARTVGVRYTVTMAEAWALVTSGVWQVEPGASEDADPQAMALIQPLLSTSAPAENSDMNLEVYQMFTWVREGDKMVYKMVDFCKNLMQIVTISNPPSGVLCPISLLRLLRTEKKAYSDDSVGYAAKGATLTSSHLLNAGLSGMFAEAQPPTFISGITEEQAKDIESSPGSVTVLSGADVKVTTPTVRFNSAGLIQGYELIDSWLEGIYGVSTLGTSEALPSGTTATAINTLNMADAQAADNYLMTLAQGLVHYFTVMRYYLAQPTIFFALKGRYGDAIKGKPEDYARPASLQISAAGGIKTKQELIAALQMLLQLATVPGTNLDTAKIVDVIVSQLNLPVAPDSIKRDLLTMVRELATQMEAEGINPVMALAMGGEELIGQQQAEEAGALIAEDPKQLLSLGARNNE